MITPIIQFYNFCRHDIEKMTGNEEKEMGDEIKGPQPDVNQACCGSSSVP